MMINGVFDDFSKITHLSLTTSDRQQMPRFLHYEVQSAAMVQ